MDDEASLRSGELTLFSESPPTKAQTARIGMMLSLLGSLGAPAELTTALAEMSGIEFKGADLNGLRFLRGPLIVHNTPWMADIPPWMARQAMMERHEIVFGDSPYLVGPTEIAAVMYPRVMEAPMHHEMCELYLWAGTTASARHYRKPIAHYWKQVGDRAIPDKEVIVRGGRLWHEYSTLSHEIRRKVIATQTGRDRTEKKSRTPPPPPKKRMPKILGTQLDLFAA